MTSRLPSVWPSYFNNDGEIYYFDDESLSARSYTHTSNWGMIPLNIVIEPIPSSSLTSDKYSLSSCDGGDAFILSFERLSKWYHFFNEYYNLLKLYGHCNRVYTSAEDYYNYESNTKFASQMKYGSDKQTYLDLDDEFSKMGGLVEVLTFNKKTSEYSATTATSAAHDELSGDETTMVDAYDAGFFKWICDNVVPSFIIPMEYKDYWKRDRLYYPDVVKWIAWFESNNRLTYEGSAEYKKGERGELDTWNCKQKDIDCCDCEEYFNRGGARIHSAMTDWYKGIQSTIKSNNSKVSGDCFSPYIIFPTELQTSIYDLGENTIFSKDYELGVDYRTASYGDTANTHSGTVVTMDGKSMILSGGSGYTFDPTFMEKAVDGWEDYTEKYMKENPSEFNVSAFTYFAYDDKNIKYVSSANTLDRAEEDLRAKMSSKYLLTTRENGWVLLDGVLFDVNESEYAIYDKTNKYLGGRKYMVMREDMTNTPYTYVNGEKIYADLYAPKNKFYFPFFKKETNDDENESEVKCDNKVFNVNDYVTFERNNLIDDKMYYITYNGNHYEVNGNTFKMDDIEYYRVSSYTFDNSNEMLFVDFNQKIMDAETMDAIESDDAMVSSSTEHFDGKPFINVFYKPSIEIYKADEINGRTVSKLGDLRLYDVLTDNIGNDIDGVYGMGENKYNQQPKEGEVIEPLYQVGNTANISRFSKTVQDLDDIKDNKNYFVGDIIKEMSFYYVEYDGTVPSGVTTDVLLKEDGTITVSGSTVKIDGEGNISISPKIIEGITSGYTSLSAISISTSAKTKLEKSEKEVHQFYDDVYCDVTYYVGATLCRKSGSGYNLSYDVMMNNHGVEYKENVRFVKENREYYLKLPKKKNIIIPTKRNDVSAHSISYPISVYKLTQNMEHVYESQYDSSYDVAMADFKANINIFSGNGDTYSLKYSGDMETHNGLQVFPTFMEEYNLGVSSLENVDSDIYIDRGINAAFEKHLKLGEVHTMNDMLQYGNGYFKIMEN